MFFLSINLSSSDSVKPSQRFAYLPSLSENYSATLHKTTLFYFIHLSSALPEYRSILQCSGEIHIHDNEDAIFRKRFLNLCSDLFTNRCSSIGIEADNDIEAHALFFFFDIETVHLQHILCTKDQLLLPLTNFHRLRVGCIDGINTVSAENEIMFPIHRLLYAAGQLVHLTGGQCVGNLYMNRPVVCVRTVIVKHQIVGTGHFRKAVYRFPNGQCQPGIRTFS